MNTNTKVAIFFQVLFLTLFIGSVVTGFWPMVLGSLFLLSMIPVRVLYARKLSGQALEQLLPQLEGQGGVIRVYAPTPLEHIILFSYTPWPKMVSITKQGGVEVYYYILRSFSWEQGNRYSVDASKVLSEKEVLAVKRKMLPLTVRSK